MAPLALLGVGVAIVLGGVLILRMHAFLALTLAALAVAALTPQPNRVRYLAGRQALRTRQVASAWQARIGVKDPPAQELLVVQANASGQWQEVGRFLSDALDPQPADAKLESQWINVQPAAAWLDSGADTMLLREHDWAAARKQAAAGVGDRVGSAFGATCGKIGILIALAAIIGKCLLDSGAADRIVRSALALVGQRGAPAAFVGSGFLLAIPVFFDTVFYLLMPLGKALRMRTGRNYLLYILSIVAGATMAHSLVPPTPGPLLVAGELGVDIGLMILGGGCVGLFTAGAGFLFATIVSRFTDVPLRESAESLRELEQVAARDVRQLPPLWLSVLPILLPVVLIAGNTLRTSLKWNVGPLAEQWMNALGNKNIALAIAALIALATLVAVRRISRAALADAVQQALASGGVIILITAAGGAFGATLQQTGIVERIRALHIAQSGILVMAFFITMAIRTAQGSSTVAMITAVGVLSGFADPEALGCHPLYLALAIGCGSKPIAWMNDSGFWVICKMSGMTEGEGLRFVTPMSILMGFTGLAVVLAASRLLPLTG